MDKLNIGIYCLAGHARSEAHIKDLRECGIDFIANLDNDRKCLDLLHKYGLKAMLGDVTQRFSAPMYDQETALAAFCDHPAVWGFDVGDEPGADDFAQYSKLIELIKEKYPQKIPYINLYPSYGQLASLSKEEAQKQLGTNDYGEYIDRFVKSIDLPYICYDHYMYSNNVETALEDLKTVSDACKMSGRDMWIVLQVNSHRPDRTISYDQLMFQAGSALAFGAKVITWACWTKGWWYNNVLDENGEKTGQYELLKKTNKALHEIEPLYMKLSRQGTYVIDENDSVSLGRINDIKASGKMIVGHFLDKGNDALVISNAGSPWGDVQGCGRVEFSSVGEFSVNVNGERIKGEKALDKFSIDIPSCGFAVVVPKT